MPDEKLQARLNETLSLYNAAVTEEDELRATAFVSETRIVAGVEVPIMNGWSFNVLSMAQNIYIVGGYVSIDEACKVLWVLSEQGRKWWQKLGSVTRRRNKFLRRINMDTVLRDVKSYIRDIFMDAPRAGLNQPPEGEMSPSIASSMAHNIHVFALTYGWRECDILSLPLPRLYQYLRLITRHYDPEAVITNERSFKLGMETKLLRHEIRRQRINQPN